MNSGPLLVIGTSEICCFALLFVFMLLFVCFGTVFFSLIVIFVIEMLVLSMSRFFYGFDRKLVLLIVMKMRDWKLIIGIALCIFHFGFRIQRKQQLRNV